MAKKKETDKNTDKQEASVEEQKQTEMPETIPYTVHAQYIRDMSFENPDALESLKSGQPAPEMDINIGMDARRVQEPNIPYFYEVALNIKAEAKRNDKTLFIAELQYGIAVSISEQVPEDNHHPVLLIEIPRFAFPFARQIMSNLTSQGGYPPLMMNPVDFHGLYMDKFVKKPN